MLKVYGIKNCDTVKKALRWLDKEGKEYEFIDFKKHIPTQKEIKDWKKAYGDWPVNRKGRTYKMIKDDFESADSRGKMAILQEKTSAIKRPIVTTDSEVLAFGFDDQEYAQNLDQTS